MPNAEGSMETVSELVRWALSYGEAPPRLSSEAEDAVAGLEQALAAARAENEQMRKELHAMMRFDSTSTELLDWLMGRLSFLELQRLGVPDPRRPCTRGDLLAARSCALAAQEGA